MKQFWAPMLLHKISEDTIMRTLKWYEDIEALNSSFADCTYVIFQLLSTVRWSLPPGRCILVY